MFRTALIRTALIVLCLGLSTVSSLAQDAASITDPPERSDVDLLIDVLSDDAARQDLLDRLQAVDGDTPPEQAVEALAGDGSVPSEVLTFGRRIAVITQDTAESIADRASFLWSRLAEAPDVLEGLSGVSMSIILDTVDELILLIVGTFAVFLVLRQLAMRTYRRLGAASSNANYARRVGLWLFSAFIDFLIVVFAWAAGYLIATTVLGIFGQIGIRQTLYLNAFLLVETVKVGVRMILSPSSTDLRPLPMADTTARQINGWVNFIVGVVGYGQLLVLPIVNAQVSYVAGSAVTALIALIVLGISVVLVLRNRRRLANWMTGEGGIASHRGSIGWIARHWHWPVLAYLFAMFVIVLVSPASVVFETLMTSGQVVLVVLLGIAVSTFFGGIMTRGIIVPDNVRDRLPLLETRLNRFIPRALFVLRLIIVVFVVLFALDAINVVDLRGWLVSRVGLQLTGMFFSVFAILVVAFALWLALTSYVDYRLNPEYGQIATAREKTLLTLGRNAATIALIIITLMFVMSEIGLNIGPLLASAGVLGLAIGFGAQKMVQDIITGVFIQFENAINVGDVITAGGTTGTVERLTIRSVSLRDLSGVYHIIPFSSVDMVSNYMRDFGYYLCDMGIAYRENIEEAKTAMLDAFDELKTLEGNDLNIVGEFEWFGVQELADSAVILRSRVKCAPGTQWGIGRQFIEICKRIFDERGIEIPFPHQTVYLGEAKDGSTQTFNVSSRTQIEGRVQSGAEGLQSPDPDPDPARRGADDRAATPSQDVPPDEP
ncbi:mechanosensitive ion channel domain-containing protein [Palleronia abyssalis]|uniref:Moderate conductance mechanosensitive channel YbiO n=1 Tax=Palleronia abyssalis TaxID=1501240 RepID=A0A2R8BS72_9RHOB|nr:mechanosensitive ion channel domain-containing protein [Palleronia abyssalis]SPJ23034.1 Moderate conductance mechanosensitive channel YbiO [Palleronia abyssalis]